MQLENTTNESNKIAGKNRIQQIKRQIQTIQQKIDDLENQAADLRNTKEAITKDTVFTAVYEEKFIEYTLTFENQEGISIKVTKGKDELTSGAVLHYDDTITIEYDLEEGYTLSSFDISGVENQGGNQYKVTGNVEITYSIQQQTKI